MARSIRFTTDVSFLKKNEIGNYGKTVINYEHYVMYEIPLKNAHAMNVQT